MKAIGPLLKTSWPFIYGLVIVCFFALSITGKDLKYFPGDLGDARFNNYVLEHSHKFFIGEEKSFWNAPFMYPEKEVISYSDNLVGSAPFYSIFRLIGFDRESSFQLWFIAMMFMSFICCYFFLKSQFKNKYAGVLGALIFTISLAIQSQMTHAQVFPRFPIPLAFWMLFLFMKDLSPKYFFATIFFVVLQFYCGIYLGFMLSVPIGIMFLLILISQREKLLVRLREAKWGLTMFASLIVNLLFLFVLMYPYYERSKMMKLNLYENIVGTLPTIRSFFYSKPGNEIWNFLSRMGFDYVNRWDHEIFVGGVAMLSFILFVAYVLIKTINSNRFKHIQIEKSSKLMMLTAVITFLLFTRYQEHSFYQLIFHIPGFSSLRSLTRIINIELIFFAFATCFIITQILKKQQKIATPLFLFLSIIIVIDNYYEGSLSFRTDKHLAQSRVNKLIEKMDHIPEGSVVSYEPNLDNNPIENQLDAMLAAQTLNLISINGYSATSPNDYRPYWIKMTSENREHWLSSKSVQIDTLYVIK